MGNNINLSKKDIKQAIKETLQEQKLTENDIRKIVREEIIKINVQETLDEANNGIENKLGDIVHFIFSKNFLLSILLFVLTILDYFSAVAMVCVINQIPKVLKLTINANLLLLGIFLIGFISCVVLSFFIIKIYDKLKKLSPKYAKPIFIFMVLICIKNFDVDANDFFIIFQ